MDLVPNKGIPTSGFQQFDAPQRLVVCGNDQRRGVGQRRGDLSLLRRGGAVSEDKHPHMRHPHAMLLAPGWQHRFRATQECSKRQGVPCPCSDLLKKHIQSDPAFAGAHAAVVEAALPASTVIHTLDLVLPCVLHHLSSLWLGEDSES